jgi:hypothetical protein
MKTEKELTENILKITMTIQEEFPELIKFLNEMPETIPDVEHPEINTKILQDYFNSLKKTLQEYAPNHSYFGKTL